MKPLLIADLFCGAGGSSTGAEKAIRLLGRKMTLVCINHWPVAIETHKKNHPTARHYVEDVAVADPYKIVPEGYLDLLMASPECRFYSRARGGRPVHDQGRMNPWAIHRWLTALDVKFLLVENVPEFVDWGPLLLDGRPDPKGKGLFFQAWIKSLWEMGYSAEWRYLNAANYGDATTRTRFFLIARKDGNPIFWPEPTHSPDGQESMIDHLPRWRAAKEIIDWANPGRSLLDDPHYQRKPLSAKTLKRIARGLEKFGGSLAPLYIQLLGLAPSGAAAGPGRPAPFIMGKQSTPSYRGLDKPMPSITTKSGNELVQPTARPFVMGKQGHSPAYRSSDKPVPTITADGRPVLIEPLAEPFIIGQQSGGAPRSKDKPIPTVAGDGAIGLVSPTMIKFYGTAIASSINKPVPTLTTKARFGLVAPTAEPVVVQVNHGGGDDRRLKPVSEPLGTITTKHGMAVVTPFIVPQYGERKGQRPRVHGVDKPLPAATSHGAGALVQPFIVQWDQTGGNSSYVRPVDAPLATIITKRNIGIIEPILKAIENGQVDARRVILINGKPYMLDLRFRMLTNLELARAMGFSDKESTYEFVGNISEVTRQIGNAVPVNMAKALVTAIFNHLKKDKGSR